MNSARIFSIIPILKKYIQIGLKPAIFFSILMLFAAKISSAFTPMLFKSIVDNIHFANDKEYSKIFQMIILYSVMWVLTGVLSEIKEILFSRASQKATNSLYINIFNHIQNLGMSYNSNKKTGEIIFIIQNSIKSIEKLLVFFIMYILPLTIEFLAILLIVGHIYPAKYYITLLATVVSYSIFVVISNNKKISIIKKTHQVELELSSKITDSILNFELIKYCGKEDYEKQKLYKALIVHEKQNLICKKFTSITNIAQHIIMSIGFSIFVILAAKDVFLDHISVGDFILLNSYIMQLNQPFKHLGLAYKEIKTSLSNIIDTLETLTKTQKHKNEHKKNLTLNENNLNIEINNLYFNHEGGINILKNISCKIPQNAKIAIVGESGSGKSTFAKIITGYYGNFDGKILLGGTNIQDISRKELLKIVAFIPQEALLFNNTIMYNLLYQNNNVTQEEISRITKAFRIDDFVSRLPDKYDTIVGEKGGRLSRGEKQRISIARTLLKKETKIIIADEITAALDNKIALAIENNITDYSKNKTLIMISHKLSSISNFDKIFVMHNGIISETGTHNSLLSKNGLYKKLWSIEQTAKN